MGSFIFSLFVEGSKISALLDVYPVVPIFTLFIWVVSSLEVQVSLIFELVVGISKSDVLTSFSSFEVVFWILSSILVVLSVISSFEVLSKLVVVWWFSAGFVIGISVLSLSKEVVGISSLLIEVLGTILPVFAISSVVSSIKDDEISLKEVVFNLGSFSIFVDSNILLE